LVYFRIFLLYFQSAKKLFLKLAQFNRIERMIRIGNLLILLVGDAGIEPVKMPRKALF